MIDVDSNAGHNLTKVIVIFVLASATLPFTLEHKIGVAFTKISQFTFLIIAYLIIVMFVQMFSYNKHYKPTIEPKYTPFKFDVIELFTFYGNYIYAFNCIGKAVFFIQLKISIYVLFLSYYLTLLILKVNVFVMRNQLKKRNDSRHIKKIFGYTVILLFIFYFSVSIIGYASFGNDCTKFDLIIQRPALEGSKDIPMKIGYVMISFQGLHSKYSIYNC